MDVDVFNSATTDSDGTITFPSFSSGVNTVKHQYRDTDWWTETFSTTGKDKNLDASATIAAKCIENKVKNLKFNIQSVSVFVLTNLIFPEAKVMEVKKAIFPGDLLVLGDVVKNYNPRATL